MLEYAKILELPDAKMQHRESVKHWFDGNKPIVRSESEWLSNCLEIDDYFSFKPHNHDTAGVEYLLESAMKRWPHRFQKVFSQFFKAMFIYLYNH